MAPMGEFRLLGPMCLRSAGKVVDLGTPKQRAVLVALLVDAGRPVSMDTLIARVWGEDPPAQARSAVYAHVMHLRRLLGELPDPLVRVTRGAAGYTIEVDPDAVDLFRFQDLVARAGDPGLDDESRLTLLRDALALWAGQPLADLGGDWIERTRDAWREQYLDTAVAWARAELRAGDPSRVPGRIRALTAEYPLVEPLAAVLLEALGTVGRTSEALHYYAGFRRHLAVELGTEPGSEVQAVHRALLRGEYDQPAPVPHVHRPTGRRHGAAMLSALVMSWCLTIAALAALWIRFTTQTHSAAALATAAATLGICGAVVTALVPRHWRQPERRFRAATGTAATIALFAVVVPLTADIGRPAAAPDPPPRTPASTWTARTLTDAPMFVESGQLILTVPAHAQVRVKCRYSGRPPAPWRSGGTEYHIVAPGSGHIPDQYLAFDGPGPVTLPHCHAKPPR